MGDSIFKFDVTTTPSQQPEAAGNLVHDWTASDANDSIATKLGRVGEVTGKGLLDTKAGIIQSAENFVKPENWEKDAVMIGTSAAFGVVMRAALPESGALKTIAGVAMGAMFLKDAAMPVINSWGKVWNDGSSKTMTAAAKSMGDGLGDFAVQGTISVIAAGAAAKMTPGLMNKVAPETWKGIETWKANNLVGRASSVALADSSVAAKLAASSGVTDKLDLSKSGLKLDIKTTAAPEVTVRDGQPAPADATKPGVKDLSSDQLNSILRASQRAETARVASGRLGRFGMQGSDGNFHSHDDVVNLLLQGKDPGVEPAGAIPTAKSLSLTGADLSKPDSVVIGDQSAVKGLPTEETADARARRQPGDHTRPKPPTGGDGKAKPTGDAAAQPTDLTRLPKGTDKVTDASKILNAENLAHQATAIKTSLGQISDQDGLIMDNMNRYLGAIEVRTNPAVKPLLGYEVPRQAAFDLAQQVGTDPENYMQVRDLYERFAAGALQSGTMDSSDIAAHVARMDQYAKENFTTYRDNIIKAGIDPDVALAQKPVPPLVEGTSDVQRVGTDGDGNPVYAHEGPHTVRAIYGPNGEPVWPLDMVKTPIREIGMRGVNTSGIYGHEFMHDQFGHLAEFDPEVREAKLGAAAAKAWGADADKMVDLPNGGKDPQQVLLDAVVRKMAKVEPADHDAYLTEQLGLDQQTRVMRGAKAAVTVLGEAGKSPVQVPGPDGAPVEVPLAVLVGNIAAGADVRTPTEVLAEMQGKGTPAETAQTISANVDKMLGENGKQMIPVEGGNRLSLKDAVMKVSDLTRNPKFDTYDQALPAQMSNKDILVNVAKAWADETFADWGAAAESGQSAAPYFQALSKDGLLRGATVMGQDMRSAANPLGIEAHPTDLLRPRFQADLVRALATAKGQHDQVLLDWADALEQYSHDASKPGPVTLPSMDTPGQSIKIPQEVFDKFIPELVDSQLNTPLPKLQGKTLFDILPDLRKNFRINAGISDQWLSAIQAGKAPETLPFDAAGTKITHVYGAGQLTFLKLVTGGMDPVKANDAVNAFSDFFGDKIVKDRASVPASPPSFHKLQFANMGRGTGIGDSSFEGQFGPGSATPIAQLTAEGGNFNPSTAPLQPGLLGQGARWLLNSPSVTAATSAYQIQDLLGLNKVQNDILKMNQ